MRNKASYLKWLCGLLCTLQIVWFSVGCQSSQQEEGKSVEKIEDRLLKSKKAATRIKAAKLLAEKEGEGRSFYRRPEALFIMHRASRDSNPEVRAYMATALGHIKDESSAKAIMRLLDDPSVKVKKSALEALGRIGNKSTLEAIFTTLSDRSNQVRIATISALMQFEGEKVTLEISNLLSDIDPTVSIAAADALGRRGDPAAIEALEKITRTRSSQVAQKAHEAIFLIKKKK